MKKILFLLLLLSFSHSVMCQTRKSVLQGKTGPQIVTVFPIINDSLLNINKYPIVYPLLIVNDVIIRHKKDVDYFRNTFDSKKIAKIIHISKKEAEQKGITNVPTDGALLVTTKKGHYIELLY